jgi:RNA polymerase sigma-70 factor (sigma-E family)
MQAIAIDRRMRVGGATQARMDELAAWFDAEYEGLLRFAYLVCGDRHLAQDLVQEAFVKMSLAGARVTRTGVKTYARTTVLNLARSRFRRAALERRAHARADEVPDHGDAVGARDEVWKAMDALSPRQRAVVALRYYEDLSEAEIAATLGMSAGSVKQHSDRAMRRLRETLGRNA